MIAPNDTTVGGVAPRSEQMQPPCATNPAVLAGSRSREVALIFAWLIAMSVSMSLPLGPRNPSGYLLFHTLVELAGVAVAWAMFVVMWNARQMVSGGFFLLIGVSSLFVGLLSLLHALAYKGMHLLEGSIGPNAATQLWIMLRFLEAGFFAAAVLLARRRMAAWPVLAGLGAVTALALLAILQWRIFPDCYIEGRQPPLTPFKIAGELAAVGLFLASGVLLVLRRRLFDGRVLVLLLLALGCTAAAGVAFTLYHDVYDGWNRGGHLLHLSAFFFLYRALVHTGLRRPLELLFRDLKKTEEQLWSVLQDREAAVRERTAELSAAMSELEEQRKRLHTLMRVLPGFVVLVDENRRIRFANERFVSIFGPSEGRTCCEVVCGRSTTCTECPVPPLLAGSDTMDWERSTPDGHVYHIWGHAMKDVDGRPVVLELGLNVTERRRLEGEVLKAGEAERRRVGHDLHDSLGQTLSGLSCLSDVLQQQLSAQSLPEAEQAGMMRDILTEAVRQTRLLAKGLSPVTPHPEGLAMAMRELVDEVQAVFRVRCELECRGELRLRDEMVASHLYRIAQEAVNNAARHARARLIRVELSLEERNVVLRVRDDGVGLDGAARDGDGMGLRIMQYRARAMSGSLRLDRGPAGGTVVTCTVPCGGVCPGDGEAQ